MPAIALKVAYDGSDFAGFQLQREQRTVQGALEEAISLLAAEPRTDLRLEAAGRTDAGVHAVGQVVAFRTRRDWSAKKWQGALNATLPEDVAVIAAREVPSDFSPRHDATERSYRYNVLVQSHLDPLIRHTFHHVPELTCFDTMTQAWRGLVGTKDFAAFVNTGSAPRPTRVTVTAADVHSEGNRVAFTISAVSFLYRMVRRLVGAALGVGQGVLSLADFWQLLDGNAAQRGALNRPAPTAPAKGLVLTEVSYPAPWSWGAMVG